MPAHALCCHIATGTLLMHADSCWAAYFCQNYGALVVDFCLNLSQVSCHTLMKAWNPNVQDMPESCPSLVAWHV